MVFFPEALASSQFLDRSPKPGEKPPYGVMGKTTIWRGGFSPGFSDTFFDSVVVFPQAALYGSEKGYFSRVAEHRLFGTPAF